jgi:hypothetical protein
MDDTTTSGPRTSTARGRARAAAHRRVVPSRTSRAQISSGGTQRTSTDSCADPKPVAPREPLPRCVRPVQASTQVPISERLIGTSQVKAWPPEVMSASPARRGFPLTSVMRPASVASEADMKPGNKKEQTLAHRTARDEPDAPLSCSECHRPCSTARQRTVVPRSGRRGRRFKSCTPHQCHRALMRECPALRAASHSSAIATGASKEHEGTPGKAGVAFDGQKNARPPRTT